MLHHIHRLRNKPEHVRKNVAFVSAGALTALVAVGWVAATVAGGTLNLQSTSLAAGDTTSVSAAVSKTSSAFSGLLGAVGAAAGATSSPSALTIVDSGNSSTLESGSASAATSGQEQTVIHF